MLERTVRSGKSNRSVAVRLELLSTMEYLGVRSKYALAKLIGLKGVHHVYRYFSGETEPSAKYYWRLLHLTRMVSQGRIDLETFDPVSYWDSLERWFESRESSENGQAHIQDTNNQRTG